MSWCASCRCRSVRTLSAIDGFLLGVNSFADVVTESQGTITGLEGTPGNKGVFSILNNKGPVLDLFEGGTAVTDLTIRRDYFPLSHGCLRV